MTTDTQQPATTDYFLRPGYIFVPDRPTAISTVLGSSVAVSIYDRSRKIGGMNHFLFPVPSSQEKTTAMYGNVAVLALIRMLIRTGSKVSKLEAQIFGGAYNPDISTRDIGRDNLKAARRILTEKRIKVVSEDVGGQLGRKVVFNTASCEIAVLKVERLRDSDWYPYHGDR